MKSQSRLLATGAQLCADNGERLLLQKHPNTGMEPEEHQPILCSKCGKNVATVHVASVVSPSTDATSHHADYCEECAKSAAFGGYQGLRKLVAEASSQKPMNYFTPRATQVLGLARKEADRFHHNYVGTEHMLLGLINLGQGVAVSVLQKMGLDLETVRAAVEKQVGTGQERKPPGSVPFSPTVKKALALAGKEAKTLAHSYVGTEHLLLGLLGAGEGVAARVLKSLAVDIERTRSEILREIATRQSRGNRS